MNPRRHEGSVSKKRPFCGKPSRVLNEWVAEVKKPHLRPPHHPRRHRLRAPPQEAHFVRVFLRLLRKCVVELHSLHHRHHH